MASRNFLHKVHKFFYFTMKFKEVRDGEREKDGKRRRGRGGREGGAEG